MVALALHGVAHSDDLAVQSFARHLATRAPGRGRWIIAGMRAFLEDKPQLLPDPPWSARPSTGHRAVELLATAAGCSDDDIDRARAASRRDLAGSAWILDPADGLDELLDLAGGRARVVVLADADDPATAPVLDALELTDRVTMAASTPARDQTLVIDAAWPPRLVAARAVGHRTALVDRFRTGDGEPDLRAGDLAGLLPGVAAWLDATTGGRA